MALQFSGFKGEGITDGRVWIQKTHFPYKFPYQYPFNTQVVLCCVRNPMDVFVSQFIQLCTMTHNKNTIEDFTQFPQWKLHIEQEVKIWRYWNEYWIAKAREQAVPIYFFRFEDLLENPESELNTILSLALGVNPDSLPQDSLLRQRITDAVLNNGSVLYPPRFQGGIDKNRGRYSEEQQNLIKTELRDVLSYFGYTSGDTCFYTYEDDDESKSGKRDQDNFTL